MGKTYSRIYIHLVFGTKHRKPLIKPTFEERLKAYLNTIAKEHNIRTLAINGTANHLHLLQVFPTDIAISRAVQIMKESSSKWINENFYSGQEFRWQNGYGAFSVHESMVFATRRYIEKQKEHHAEMTYRNEFEAILRKHNIG